MTAHALLFTLAAIGISETVYLIKKRLEKEKPVCVFGQSCQIVLASKYNHVFLIHNDVAGLLFYIVISFITAFLVIGIEPMQWWDLFAKAGIGFAGLMSIFFVYLQARVIKAWCFWCLMSALTIWLMGFIVLVSNLTNI